MADSSVAITAGSGTAIDTRTEGTNGNHRQVIVIGDPATNAGVAPVDATNGLTVDMVDDYTRQVGRIKIVNDAGTVIDPVSQVAHDAADSGNPTKVGFKARDALSDATLVAEDDRTDAYAGLDGVQIVRPHAAEGDFINACVTASVSTSVAFIAAQGAGISVKITDVVICNSSSTDTFVALTNGTGEIARFPVPANGGVTHSFGVPLTGAADTAISIKCNGALADIVVTGSGYATKL